MPPTGGPGLCTSLPAAGWQSIVTLNDASSTIEIVLHGRGSAYRPPTPIGKLSRWISANILASRALGKMDFLRSTVEVKALTVSMISDKLLSSRMSNSVPHRRHALVV